MTTISRVPLEFQALEILPYPHPSLRHRGKPLRRVDAELGALVREMFARMYEAKGVGLAATQVGLPYRLFVVNLSAEPGAGQEQVFINPVLSRPKGNEEAEEGCLSLPGLYAPVHRPPNIHVSAYNLEGEEISGELSGLAARVVQHEADHLDGVLFIDRLSPSAKASLRDAIVEMETRFAERQVRNEIPDDRQIAEQLAALEEKYC